METTKQRLTVKDLVLIGVLSAVIAVIYLVVGMVCGMSPITNAFYPIIGAIPNGIIYMLLLAKVPKKGVFTITGIVSGLLLLLVGCFWFIPLCMAVAGVIADFVVLGKEPRNANRMLIGYVVSVVGITFGYNGSIVLMRDAFTEVMIRNGIAGDYINTLNTIISDPMLLVMVALGIVAALLGGLLGRKLLKKHFIRAGLVSALANA